MLLTINILKLLLILDHPMEETSTITDDSTTEINLSEIAVKHNGHFSLTRDGKSLFDRFCGRKVNNDELIGIDVHVLSEKHVSNYFKFPIRQKIEKGLKRKKIGRFDKDSIEQMVDQLNSTVQMMKPGSVCTVSDIFVDRFIDRFIEESTGRKPRLNKVELIRKALILDTFADEEGSLMKCNICDIKLNDRFSSLARHITSREHQKAVAVKTSIDGKKLTAGVVDYVTQDEFLLIEDGKVRCIPCDTVFESSLCTIKYHVEQSGKHTKRVELYKQDPMYASLKSRPTFQKTKGSHGKKNVGKGKNAKGKSNAKEKVTKSTHESEDSLAIESIHHSDVEVEYSIHMDDL